MSLVRSVFTIGGFTFLSRVLGFVRDILIAAIMGAGLLSDAFFVAFKLPNFMRRIFAEGAFSAGFVPMFSRLLAGDGKEAARRFAEEALAVLFFTLLVLTALFEIAMPWFMHVLAPGFVDDPQKFDLTVELSRITFPYLLMISLVALLGGVLNSLERFAAFASAPILMNLSLIFGILVMAQFVETPAHGLAWGVFLAGVVQLAWLLWWLWKAELWLKLRRPRLTPKVRRLLRLILPMALGASVAQINLMIDVILASLLPAASVSYLYYADRLNELPLGVIGIAVGTALLPMLSKQIRLGEVEESRRSLNRAVELAMLLCLPAAAALLVIPEPVIKVLFERGAFDAATTEQTAAALMAYAIGLPSFVLIKVFAPACFAREDTKTPVIIATIALGVNLVLNLILMGPLLHVGLALATSLAGWLNAGLLAVTLYRREHFVPDRRLTQRMLRIVFSCGVMAACLWGMMQWLLPWWEAELFTKVLGLLLLVAAGMGIFFVAVMMTRAADIGELKRYFLRKKR